MYITIIQIDNGITFFYVSYSVFKYNHINFMPLSEHCPLISQMCVVMTS